MERKFKRVVGLMMENQTFDRMLGFCPGVGKLDGTEFQLNHAGEKVYAHSGAHPVKDHSWDPPHGHDAITAQMWGDGGWPGPGVAPPGDHQLRAHEGLEDDKAAKAFMGCFSPEKLPAMTTLAQSFVTCDRWFCSVPGPTSPNRMFVHAATSAGSTAGCYLREQGLTPPEAITTTFENLDQYRPDLGWKVYGHDNLKTAQAFPYVRARPEQNGSLRDFFDDCEAGTLPGYCWLVPELNWQSQHAGGGGAEHGLVPGDDLIADVFEALRAQPQLWDETLFVITYDECGGYWDSQPALAVPTVPLLTGEPSVGAEYGLEQSWPPTGSVDYDFGWSGKRVPTILVSPYLDKAVCSADFEHASIAGTLKQLWGLEASDGPDGFLTERAQKANKLGDHLVVRDTPRLDCPETLPRSEYRKRPAVRADAMTDLMEAQLAAKL